MGEVDGVGVKDSLSSPSPARVLSPPYALSAVLGWDTESPTLLEAL